MSVTSWYGNKNAAVKIAADLTGFVYYVDGKVALCEAAFSDYQNNHYCYDKNGSLLLAIDALGIGYAQASVRKDADLPQFSITFTVNGGLITNNNKVTDEWSWAHPAAKGHPVDTVRTRLNEHWVFVYKNRNSMFLEFECEGIKYTSDISIKQRRKEPSYLATAKRDATGRLLLPSKAKTLKQRTEDFNKKMLVKQNLVHPKSENLSDMVSGIVLGLENKFGDVNTRMMTSPSPGKTWKGDALTNTISELPKIALSGMETGKVTGLGTSIYSSLDAAATRSGQPLPGHLVNATTGGWKNDTEVRSSLLAINPVLKRTNVLKCNSGRYSSMLVVDPAKVTAHNPTGMVATEGLPLELITWNVLKGELEEQSKLSGSSQLLTVGIIGRVGEVRYSACLRMAALTNLKLAQEKEASETQRFRMVRIEVGENSDVLKELSVKYLPTFVMWSQGRMMYKGQAGGAKVAAGPVYRPKVMLIENHPRFQLAIEKHLKKLNCDSFLCITASAALDALQNLMLGNSKDAFDLVLVSGDMLESSSAELSVLRGKLAGAMEQKRTVVAAMVTTVGEQGLQNLKSYEWDGNYCSADVAKLPGAGRLIQHLSQKPVKAVAIAALLEQCSYKGDDIYVQLGVTPEAFLTKMVAVREQALKGAPSKEKDAFGKLHLSVQDVKYAGTNLVNRH